MAPLRRGLEPQAMEDEWFVHFEEPSLRLRCSWTGQAVYRIAFAPGGRDVSRAACDEAVLGDGGDVTQHARVLGFLIGNLMLGRREPFPLPDTASGASKGIYQQMFSGTGYRETDKGGVPRNTERAV